MNKWLLTLCLALVIGACSPSTSCDMLILNVVVIDVKNDSSYAVDQLAIRNGKIIGIGSNNYKADTVIDGEGQFIMPGLWDMHVHFRGGDSLISENEAMLPLFIRHGVTTVRDAGGDITPAVLKWKNEIGHSQRLGPRIFTSGPKLDGPNPAWPGSLQITDSLDVVRALDSLSFIGVDYVKIYDGSLSAENYYRIIALAKARGYKTTGHMPMDAYLTKAVKYGLNGSEHMHYLSKACSPHEDSLTQLNKGYSILKDIYSAYNASHAATVIAALAENNFYITPTLHISKTLGELADADHSQDELLSEMGPGIVRSYQRRIESAKRAKARGSSRRLDGLNMSLKMLRPMYDLGLTVLAGSDCGAFNSYVYPGEALHRELELMVQGGLSPAEALCTSIINGPKFFDLQQDYGAIAKGKQADLVLLTQSPLEDITHLKSITAVINQNTYKQIQ